MSTTAFASAVFDFPISQVWAIVRDFRFPQTFFNSIQKLTLENDASPTSVGAVRRIQWSSGEVKRQLLLEVSDQYYRVAFETIETCTFPSEVAAEIHTIKLRRVGESNGTFISWETEYAAQTPGDLVAFQTKALQDSLNALRNGIAAGKTVKDQKKKSKKKSKKKNKKKKKSCDKKKKAKKSSKKKKDKKNKNKKNKKKKNKKKSKK